MSGFLKINLSITYLTEQILLSQVPAFFLFRFRFRSYFILVNRNNILKASIAYTSIVKMFIEVCLDRFLGKNFLSENFLKMQSKVTEKNFITFPVKNINLMHFLDEMFLKYV